MPRGGGGRGHFNGAGATMGGGLRGLGLRGKRGGGGRRGSMDEEETNKDKPPLTLQQLLLVLSPFFWPNQKASDDYWVMRLRSCATWLCVFLSKASAIAAPLYLSKATNSLVQISGGGQGYRAMLVNVAITVSLRFFSSFFKEMQSVLFLRVKQQAFVELSTNTFAHVHSLSLNWHMSKKTGNVVRSMDRGTDAAAMLVSLCFLFLGPSLLECVTVCFLFFFHFELLSLSVLVCVSVCLYAFTTILITNWR